MTLTTATRNKRIRIKAKKGVTLAKIAAQYDLTPTRVWQITNKVRAV